MSASESVSAQDRERIRDNWRCVVDEVAAACRQSGRDPEDVTIVAVSKYVGPGHTRALFDAGCRHLGESRPQQLWEKTEALSGLPVAWHMIGHLQRNKARRTVPGLHLLHSVDTVRLAQTIDALAESLPQKLDCLLEINVSGDANKHGFEPSTMLASMRELSELKHLNFRGLMCMASASRSAEDAGIDFGKLRELRDELLDVADQAWELPELSMGMSRDFGAAIAQGATIVRIGSRLFDGIDR